MFIPYSVVSPVPLVVSSPVAEVLSKVPGAVCSPVTKVFSGTAGDGSSPDPKRAPQALGTSTMSKNRMTRTATSLLII